MAERAAVIRRVLQDLKVLSIGESPDEEDAQVVSDRIDSACAELSRRRVTDALTGDEIDDGLLEPFVAYVVEVCAPAFGRDRDPRAKKAAEMDLRTITRIGRGSGENLRVDSALLAMGRTLRFGR